MSSMEFAAFERDAFVASPESVSPVAAPGEGRLTCVAGDGRGVFCGSADGLYRASVEDLRAGRVDEWTRVLAGHVTSVTVSPHDGAVYVGTEPTTLYRSDDGGDAWTELADPTTLPSASEWSFPPRPQTHHARWVHVDPHDPETLYVAVEAGALIRSFDGGDSWVDRVPSGPFDTHSMATHPDAPGLVYAAAGDGFYRSDDGGDEWTSPESGLRHRYCWSVAVDPGDPETVYCSAASGPRSAHSAGSAESYVYRRRDGEWERLADAPGGRGTLRPVLAATDPETVYALSNRGLDVTTDAGETWRRAVEFAAEDETPSGLLVQSEGNVRFG